MARKPKVDTVKDGVRYRAFSTRSEIEVMVGEGEIEDPAAEVWVYPKVLGLWPAVAQAKADGRH